jgi:hypothetical protein
MMNLSGELMRAHFIASLSNIAVPPEPCAAALGNLVIILQLLEEYLNVRIPVGTVFRGSRSLIWSEMSSLTGGLIGLTCDC